MRRIDAIEILGVTDEQFTKYLQQYEIPVYSHHITRSEYFQKKDIDRLAIALNYLETANLERDEQRKLLEQKEETLETQIKDLAGKISTGHYTLVYSSSGYRGLYATYSSRYEYEDWINVSPAFSTIGELCVNMLSNWQQHIIGDRALKKQPSLPLASQN